MKVLLRLNSLITFFILAASALTLRAQVVINEICPSNISIIQNSNGKYDDWIEIYNAGASTVNLSGYGLSDDQLIPYRFTFPSCTLGAGKRMLIFASDSNSTVSVDHWEMSVSANTTWKYAIGSAAIDTNWRNLSFNDGSWSSGAGGIGFGDGDDGTTVATTTSVLMRKTFNIPDTSQILKAAFMMDYDDGFVAYLNGVEIARANLGTSGTRPLWNDLALSSHEAQMYQGLPADSFFINPAFLKTVIRNGTNVLTVETHNVPSTSTDLSSNPYLFFGMRNSGMTFSALPSWFLAPSSDYYNAHFKMSRSGETVYLTNTSGTLIDQKAYVSFDIDNSYGRKPDGGGSWCFFATPTPNASNNTSVCYTGYASIPLFSLSAGFYPTTQTLSLSTSVPGGVIRYTINGDVPTATDPAYTSPISISGTVTIRARVFASGYLPSTTITNTYFIGEDIHLPVFTITTDSLNLWDYNTGIYVMGPNASATSPYFGANFWQDWRKPATMEYYDKGKNRILRFDGEIMMYGNYSRAKPQKSFEIKLSDKYGTSSVSYPFFSEKPFISSMDDIVLRNAGTDWNVVHFRDGLMERLMRNTYIGHLAYEPAVMFLNGAFWGVYTIQENHDENWMQYNYGLGKSKIDFLKEKGNTISIRDGSDSAFWSMYNYATTQTATTQAYYDYMNSVLDLQNYTDYFAAETFYDNGDWIGDWTNNIMIWRPNDPGSKWKYFMYDLDFGLGLEGSVNDNRLSIARNPAAFSYSSKMFNAILNNPTYKRYFINRYADLINTVYLYNNVSADEHSFQDSMAYDMPAHFAKWGSNMATWQSNINTMMNFVSARPAIVRDQIKTMFSMTSQVTLTLNVSPAGAGRIEISTITPTTYPWSGVYFNGNPVTITAIPNPGYTFDHWRSNVTIPANNYNQSATFNFTANDGITAYFTGSAVNPLVTVSELNYHSDSLHDAGDWVELHNYGTQPINLSGWKLSDDADNHMYHFPTGTVIPAGGYLVLMEDTVKFKTQFPGVTNSIGPIGFNFSNGGEQVRLFNYKDSLYLSFNYQDLAPWPLGADGLGYTLELLSQTGNLSDGNNWFAGCIGGSPGRAYSPLLSVPISVTGNTTFCTGGSVTLSVTSTAGYTYQWKRNNANIFGATTFSYTATQAGSYTLTVANQGCSATSSPTVITVVTQGPDPTVTSAYRCGAGPLTLTATATDSIFWYDAPNGNLVETGPSFTTPSISQTTTYYARASRSCPSSAVPVLAQILLPTAPPVTADVNRCGPGTATLSATDTAAMRWYNDPVAGAQVATGASFVTNLISNDTVFYVEAGNTCPSPRIEAHVHIVTTNPPDVSDTSRCGNGTMVLMASAAAPVSWYSHASGGTPLATGFTYTTPVLTVTDTFYAEANSGCPSARVAAIAIVNRVLPAPSVQDVANCGPGIVTLSATSPEQVYWFDSPSGGNLLYTGTIFETPNITNTTVYYAEAGYQCRSARSMVQAVIDTVPDAPVATDASRCGSGSVTLMASSPVLIKWYDDPNAGNLVNTGDVFVTPSLSSSATYYAEADNACSSAARTAVQAIIFPAPVPPITSDVNRCGTGTVTLTAASPDPLFWYSAATGGTLLGTGANFTTPSLSATTTYYVESANANCSSGRLPVQAIIGARPSPPVASDVSRCGNGTLTLTASSVQPIYWFSSASGGSPISSGSSYTTPALSATTTYYAEAGNGCTSQTRTAVQAIINSIPAAPSSADVSRCGNGTVTLTASSPEQIYWYSAASGGTLLGSSPSFTTPSITATTTYYVETGNNCRSTRIAVQAVVNPVPAAPTSTDVSRCTPGVVTLTASSPEQVYWYDAATNGNLLYTGAVFTTPSLTATTAYYAEAGDVCRSLRRTVVQAIIGSIPAAPTAADVSRCGSGTMTLTAASPDVVSWYSSATGGTLLFTGSSYTTPSLSATTTYYAEAGTTCRSVTRTAVQAIINAVPSSPIASDVSRCGTGTVTLSATASQTISWYSAATGGTLLTTGTTYNTPSLSATTTYYLEDGTTCRSNRVQVKAIINAFAAAPAASNVTRCGSGTVTLTASSPEQVYWYDTPTNGNLLFTGASYTTPALSSTTTYYAEAGNTCRSQTRTSVQAIIGNIPAAPTTSNVSRCGTGTVTLTASSLEQVYWYSAATGGTLLFTGSSYTTPSLSATTTYYAEAGNTCRSASRAAAQAIINAAPAAPVASDVSRCGPGTVTLSATASQAISWYSAATGGTLLTTGTSYTTTSLSATTTYYLEDGTTCRSNRVQVKAIINAFAAAPAASNVNRCGTGTLTLTASSPEQVYWYDAPTNGNLLFTGAAYTTPSLSSTTTYYAEAGNTCRSQTRTSVQAIIGNIPAAPTTSNVSRCGTGTVTLTASSPEQVYWYSAATGGTLLFTGSSYTTPSLSATTTYYAEAGNTCRSASRAAAQAIINAAPAAPVASDVSRCGPGTVTLSATASQTISWYSAATGGTLLTTGTTYTTPSLTATTTYYVEDGTTCHSSRIQVQAIINGFAAAPAASDVSRCGTGTVTLTASSPEQVYWYNAATGGTLLFTGSSFTTPALSATTTYYAEAGNTCRSLTRTAVQAIIGNVPAAPTTSNVSRCGNGTVTLTASSPEQVYWYSAATGGTLLFTGSSYTTPSLAATTTYYAEAGNTCRSTRAAAQAIINAIPAVPVTSDVSRCGPGTLTLTAASPEQIYWYDAPTGGSLLHTGSTLATPSLTVTTTYYVETGNNCRSTRISVRAIIDTLPAPPVVTDVSRCGPGSVVLSATSPVQVNWYDAATGGTLLGTGSSFSSPAISANTTFYTDAGWGCNSLRVPVQATVLPLPAAPVVTGDSGCAGSALTLHAIAADSLSWYNAATGGTALDTGTTFITPTLSVTTTYYAEAGDGCRSARVPVTAMIRPVAADPVVYGASSCGPGSTILTAYSTDSITWYDQPVGGHVIGHGSFFTTPVLTTSAVYYVIAGTDCPSNPVEVNASVLTPPVVDLGPDTITIQSGQTADLDAGPGFLNYDWSTGDSTQFITVVATGTYHVTVTDAGLCTASDQVFVNVVTGVHEAGESVSFIVYPNPAHGSVLVSGSVSAAAKIAVRLYSIDGRLLMFRDVRNFNQTFSTTISLEDIAAGMYFLRVDCGGREETIRLVVQ